MFRDTLKNEQRRIQRLIDLTAFPQESAPSSLLPAKDENYFAKGCLPANEIESEPGLLHLESRRNSVYCYEEWFSHGKRIRKKYLGKLHSEPVNRHVKTKLQKERTKRLIHDRKLLQQMVDLYLEYDYASVVSSLPSSYQRAAGGDFFDERYEELKAWANADYVKNPYPFPKQEIYAVDGTRLRSKGECLLYNLLFEKGVLFRNDCEVIIVDQRGEHKKLYPDFLIQCFDGSFIIIEHLGRLTDLKYALDFGEKCYWYLQKGFILGKNFFVTSDDKYHGTDSHMMDELADKLERMFFGY